MNKFNETKYYRIMKNPVGNWGGYYMEPVNDNYPDFNSVHCDKPEVGEYLTINSDGTCDVISNRDYRNLIDVRYPGMPPVSKLLANGTIIEVPEQIMHLDLQMTEKKRELTDQICNCESCISYLEWDLQHPTDQFLQLSPAEAGQMLEKLRHELAELTQQDNALQAAYHEQIKPYFNSTGIDTNRRPSVRDAMYLTNGLIRETAIPQQTPAPEPDWEPEM